MNEMIDRVAAALRERLKGEWDLVGDEAQIHVCRELARLALRTAREPTGPMFDAGACEDGTVDIWQVMIDAALEGG